jgi:hypothetical protein
MINKLRNALAGLLESWAKTLRAGGRGEER